MICARARARAHVARAARVAPSARALGAISLLALAALFIAGALPAPARAQPGPGGSSGADTPPLVNGVPYQKLATRAETEARMLSLLFPSNARWGTWYLASPFPFAKRGDMPLAQPPEAELANMRAGGPGPNLQAAYKGLNDLEVSWRPLGDVVNRLIDLNEHWSKEWGNKLCAFLYTTVTVDQPATIDVMMGSDDGLRFWLNGKLVVDQDVERGLDVEDVRLKLDLQRGVNHLFAKVSQTAGAWQFQLNGRPELEPQTDALLQYFLERDFPSSPENEYYRAITIPTPPEVVLEAGGLDVLPPASAGAPGPAGQARPIVSTRRGEIWIIDGAYDDPPSNVRFTRFASGLHEPLGLAVRVENRAGKPVNAVYAVQRAELTRMIDTNGDDIADVYETVSDGWGVSGNYHEFAFGPKFDRDGNAWVTLNVGFCGSLGKSVVPYRGWALTVGLDGRTTPVCTGLRSPNGIGMFSDGAMFYLDNQGDFIGTNRLSWLRQGSFQGQPSGLRWREGWKDGDPSPPVQPATIWFPYRKMGQSTADFLLYPPDAPARFGPFSGQVFVGDQTLCLVSRVFIEKFETPDGPVYQGACFPFRKGLDCGVNRLAWGSDGSMFVGQTDRGWGSIGRRRYGVQRLVWTGKVPFEIQTMRALPDGFELTFTHDVDADSARNLASYSMVSYTYEYHVQYGSDEMETQRPRVTAATLVNPRTVLLTVDGLRAGGMGYVHELNAEGVRSAPAEGRPSLELLHPLAYYTLQHRPGVTQ